MANVSKAITQLNFKNIFNKLILQSDNGSDGRGEVIHELERALHQVLK